MKKHLLYLLLSVLTFTMWAAPGQRTITISDQQQFDKLEASVKQLLRQGVTDIVVTLKPGIYQYGEKHLDLSDLNYPKINLTLAGNGALLIAKDLNKERDWQDGAFDLRQQTDIDRWSTLEFGARKVEVVDAKNKLCRIRTQKKQRVQKQKACQGEYLTLTMCYDSKTYPIVRRESRYIYFTASDLEYKESRRDWNVNHDYTYGHVNPRYRIITPQAPNNTTHFCQASTFAYLWHSHFGSFTLRGISFGPNNGSAPLIATDMFDCQQLLIEKCSFSGVRGMVIKVWYTDNVKIEGNTFEGCYQNGIEAFNGCRNTQIIGNTFRNHGLGMQQNFAIVCRNENFVIRGNAFRNFTYGAIGIGVWYGNAVKYPITGKVEGNDIAFEPNWYADYQKHTLMDGGAIYTWTRCDRVSITGNTITRYRGMKDYRGIFCDDGARNLTIRDNRISNIGDGGYCIDLRWVDHVTKDVPDHNTGNTISGNHVDGPIRFETKKP